MLANCGKDERGVYSGGAAGDQTGSEYALINWYNRPWTYVYRYPDTHVAQTIANVAEQAARNDCIGYDQSQRITFWIELKKVGYNPKDIRVKCEADCSSSTSSVIKAAGYICNNSKLKKLSPGLTSSSIGKALQNAGFTRLSDTKYLTSDAYLLPGDILLATGHHVSINIGKGKSSNEEQQSTSGNGSSYGTSGSLYTTEYTRDDGVGREYGYLSLPDYKRTTSKTKVKLSILNYTSLLGDIAELFGYNSGKGNETSTEVDTSKLKGKPKTVIDYLISKGFSAASSCGIAGNIYYESNFNTASIGDKGTSFGICQWHNTRGSNMKKKVPNWKTNLSGQLDFLISELKSGYTSVYNFLKNSDDTETGAKKCADYFVRNFEIPANVDAQSKLRQEKAAEYYNKIVIISYDNSGDSGDTYDFESTPETELKNYKGEKLKLKKVVNVPKSVKQTGILGDSDVTNFAYFTYYNKWVATPKVLSKIWVKTGKHSKNGVATINGYFLIAAPANFGKDADVLKIFVEGGYSFVAIVADMKREVELNGTGTSWGHKKGNSGISMVEWEAVGNEKTNNGWKVRPGKILGKKVIKVENYGSFL